MFSCSDMVSTGREIGGGAGKQEVATAWTYVVRLTWDKF